MPGNLCKNTLPDIEFKDVAVEADGADLGFGDPEFGGGEDEDGFRGFAEDTDRDPDVARGRAEDSVEAPGPGHWLFPPEAVGFPG